MADVETAVAEPVAAPAVETPAAEPAPAPAAPAEPVAEATPEQPKGPLSRAEARRQMQAERVKRTSEQTTATEPVQATDPAAPTPAEPVVDEHGRKHDPVTGEYLPAAGDEDTKTPAASPPESGAPDPAAAKPQLTRIEVPEGHPIRQSGVDAIHVSTPDEERTVKALLNGTYHRRQEVESLTQKLTDLETKYRAEREKNIKLESTQAASEKWKQTPRYREIVEEYHEIRDTRGEGPAQAFWRGSQDELNELVEGEQSERMSAVAAEEAEAVGRTFISDAWDRMSKLPDYLRQLPDFGRWFSEEVDTLNMRAEKGHYPELARIEKEAERLDFLHTKLRDQMRTRFSVEPAAVAVLNAQIAAKSKVDAEAQAQAKAAVAAAEAQRIEAAKKQGAEEFKRAAADKRVASPPNPIPPGTGSGRNGAVPATPVDTSKLSAEQLRRQMKTEARELTRTYMQP